MLELIQKIKTYTEAGIILEHMYLFGELESKLTEFIDDYNDMVYEFKISMERH